MTICNTCNRSPATHATPAEAHARTGYSWKACEQCGMSEFTRNRQVFAEDHGHVEDYQPDAVAPPPTPKEGTKDETTSTTTIDPDSPRDGGDQA